MGNDIPLGSTHSAGSRGIRDIHVLAPAACEDVHEYVFAVGGAQFLDGGNSFPRDGYGPCPEGIGMAFSAEALFRGLSDECV